MVNKQTEYDGTLWAAREAERDRRLQAKLKRQARRLGYELVPNQSRARGLNDFFARLLPRRGSSSRGGPLRSS